ncbi:MAG: YjhX family toxin [Sphingomonas sp.]|nr:YjhX family toxin [Sphingomonas sp.]
MNISKHEQRVLHELARGAQIRHFRDERGKIADIMCITRDGHILSDCTLPLFERLRKRGLISSRGGNPYRISPLGIASVRAQSDNRS